MKIASKRKKGNSEIFFGEFSFSSCAICKRHENEKGVFQQSKRASSIIRHDNEQ